MPPDHAADRNRESEGRSSASLVRDPIDPAAVLARVGGPRDGAVVLFLGTVRDHHDGRAVRGLTYEAYEEMATAVLHELVQGTLEGLREGSVHAVHRLGPLGIGEVAVAVAVSSPHRGPAFEAARLLMEELKRRLPVWKHEYYAEGDSDWVAGVPLVPDSRPGSGK